MIEKIESEVISRRRAFSLLGLPVALGFAAAPMSPMPSGANAQTAAAAPGRRRVALALQGGGSHGAFTWGVLDRLLEDVARARLRITAISGASAGGINATLCACGLVLGGADAAHNQGGLAVVGRIPQSPRGVVVGVTGHEQLPAQSRTQLLDLAAFHGLWSTVQAGDGNVAGAVRLAPGRERQPCECDGGPGAEFSSFHF